MSALVILPADEMGAELAGIRIRPRRLFVSARPSARKRMVPASTATRVQVRARIAAALRPV